MADAPRTDEADWPMPDDLVRAHLGIVASTLATDGRTAFQKNTKH